jgi:arylsulfatase
VASDTPFFVWFNTTHMHLRTHGKPESRGQAGRWQSEYHDVMIDHDKTVGELLALLDELKISDNTLLLYSTDNGPHCNTWPDAGTTPFRSEKNSMWEGAYRVPAMVRFPGRIAAGSISNEIVSHLDWLPTFLAAAGEPDIVEKCKKGHKAGSKTFKVHLDGHNLLPHITGKDPKSPRKGFLYFTDDGDVAALRYDNFKIVFLEQRARGTMEIWTEPMVHLRVPKIFNLRTDPYEFADITSNTYWDWVFDHIFVLVPAQALVGEFLATFREFPPRQKAASFSIDQVVDKLGSAVSGAA